MMQAMSDARITIAKPMKLRIFLISFIPFLLEMWKSRTVGADPLRGSALDADDPRGCHDRAHDSEQIQKSAHFASSFMLMSVPQFFACVRTTKPQRAPAIATI